MSKFLRMTVLTVVMLAQLLTGINVGVSAEADIPEEGNKVSLSEPGVQPESQNEIDDQNKGDIELGDALPGNEVESQGIAFEDTEREIESDDLSTVKDNDELANSNEDLVIGNEALSDPTNPQVLNTTINEENIIEAIIKIVGVTPDTSSSEKVVTIEDGVTALSLLEEVADVEIEQYDFGPMIKSINGLEAAGTYYWALYVNGVEAPVGAGAYIPIEDDLLAFKYISWAEPADQVTVQIMGNEKTDEQKASFDEDATALTILQSRADVEVEQYDFGPMVKSINGLEAAGTYYWALYVNGVEAPVGAGLYKPKENDVLKFKYISWAETPDQVTVKIVGEDDESELQVSFDEDATALTILQERADVETEIFDFGPMVTSVNGIEAVGTYYWALYVNGVESFIGAGDYKPKKNDILTFKYISWDVHPSQVTVKIIGAETSEHKVTFDEDATALTILQARADVETEQFDSGPMIKSINGLEAADTYYWSFNVNDQYSLEGAHQYSPKVDDVLTFEYVSWEVVEKEATIEIVGNTATTRKHAIDEDSTALSLLEDVATVVTEESSWGPMIKSINGLEASATHFWAFYVNGNFATVGAHQYQPNANDLITFEYQSMETPDDPPIDEEPPIEEPSETLPFNLTEQLAKTVEWVQNKGVSSNWEALALRHMGAKIPQSYVNNIDKKVIEKDGKLSNVTDYELTVLGLVVGGKDPINVSGYNLIEKIYYSDEMTAQGLNGVVYGLLALDSMQFEIPQSATWNQDNLVDYIINAQHEDGGWSLTGSISDVDMTAMTLTALSPYKNEAEVKEAIDKAYQWLSSKQLTNGGFSGKYGENLETTATVIIALTALGEDPFEKFTRGKLADYFNSFILEDGSFKHEKDDDISNSLATEQGLLALVSYKRFLDEKGSVYDLTELPDLAIDEVETGGGNGSGDGSPTAPGEQKKQSITISVRTHESTILSSRTLEVNEGATALSALVDALGSRVETRGAGQTWYVESIDGLAEFDHGPTSGWKFSVNGYFPSGGAGTYRLNNGDQLEWVYVLKDDEAAKEKEAMGVGVGTSKPEGVTVAVFESLEKIKSDSQKQSAVLNKEQKMPTAEAQKLKEALTSNTVRVEKTVVPTAETVIASPKVDEAKIVIPKQALSEQKTIKIEELPPSISNTEGKIKSSIYQFSPKGTKFDKPVYISINIPIEDDDLDNLVMAWFDEEKSQWIPIPTVIDAKTGSITGQVDHFTKFAVINTKKEDNFTMTEELKKLVQHLQTDQTQSEWEDFGMARLGKANNQAVLTDISKVLKEANGYFRKITDYERYVLTIEALGGDPTNIGGYDLIEKIYNNERMTMQGTNGLIFALIALDSGSYEVPSTAKWSREKILAEILANQNKDGGFTLVNGDPSDVDITAMAISSLVTYADKPEVKTAIDKAVNWLSHVQQANGGFIADGSENSESVSQVIIALASAGIDPQGPLFTKANGNVVTNLLSYQTKDGGFANLKDEKSNQIASEQALLALLALDYYSKNLSSIYQVANQKDAVEVSNIIPDFADVDQISDYALQSIYKAFDIGIMYGVEKNPLRFAPKQNLTRAQFTAILVNLLEGKVSEQSKVIFTDVKPGHRYYNVVMRANELGIVRGTSNTTFSPNEPITREQVAIILARAFDLMEKETEPKTIIYNDISNLSQYNQAAIAALYDHNLMKGFEGGQFKPKNYVTREMGAVIAIRLSEKSN